MFIFLDFFQAAVYGSIKALSLQNKAIWVNIVAHQCMILPFAYILGFKVVTNKQPNEIDDQDKKGLGLRGIWIAMNIGMGF